MLAGLEGAEAVLQAEDAGRGEGDGRGGGRVEAFADGQGGLDVEQVDGDDRVVGDDPGSTPAAARRPGLARERLRSSTLEREVSRGPIRTGTPRPARRSASRTSVPWSITRR